MWPFKEKHNHPPNKPGQYIPHPDCTNKRCKEEVAARIKSNSLYCSVKNCKSYAEITFSYNGISNSYCNYHYYNFNTEYTYPIKIIDDTLGFEISDAELQQMGVEQLPDSEDLLIDVIEKEVYYIDENPNQKGSVDNTEALLEYLVLHRHIPYGIYVVYPAN